MLCCLEPVKCWSRLPNWSGATILRSTCSPVWVRIRTPASVGVPADSIRSSSAAARGKRERVGRGRDHVEVLDAVGHPPRRAGELDPLGGRVRAERCDQLLADDERAVEHDPCARLAGAGLASAARIVSSALGPKPFSLRIFCSSAAARSASSESIRSSS